MGTVLRFVMMVPTGNGKVKSETDRYTILYNILPAVFDCWHIIARSELWPGLAD